MFSIVILSCLAGLSIAAPQGGNQPPIAILSQVQEQNPDGSYIWSYETENGIKAQEKGDIKPAQDPKDGNVVVSQGSFSYTAPDGKIIQLVYVADDVGGFQAQGEHLPTPPPIPPAIQKALDAQARG